MESQPAIRRKILTALYGCHKSEAFCPLKTSDLLEKLGMDDEEEFFRALQHLHDEDYIKGTFVTYQRQGYFETARITQKGVDLVDNPAEMNRLFPSDPKSEKVERFAEDFRREVNASDAPNEEKERLLEALASPLARRVLERMLRG